MKSVRWHLVAAIGLVLVLGLAAQWMFSGGASSPSSSQVAELTISTYRSFVGKSGLGSVIIPLFEKQCQCKIRVLTQPDAGALLTRLEIDARRGQVSAQVILGLDQYLFARAQPYLEDWGSWLPSGYQGLQSDLKLGSGFVPYDYGPLGWIVDQAALQSEGLLIPHSLSDLLDPKWSRHFLLQDPRTSTPGLTFLLYTRAILGDSVTDYWKKLRSQWLTLAPSWDSSYSLFVKGEAVAIWSYLTSQAYHQSRGEGGRYQAVIFDEGQPFQVEGASLVKGSFQSQQQKILAQSFLEFLISSQVQSRVPHSTWMLPVLQNLDLPSDFLKVPQVKRRVWPDHRPEVVLKALDDWRRAVEM